MGSDLQPGSLVAWPAGLCQRHKKYPRLRSYNVVIHQEKEMVAQVKKKRNTEAVSTLRELGTPHINQGRGNL
eukprot:scaffold146246_cov18-Tisochrysis_lutea.AAC.1